MMKKYLFEFAFTAMAGLFAASVVSNVHAQMPVDDVRLGQDVEKDSESGADLSSWAAREFARAQAVYQKVQNMLVESRREKDTVKIVCLEDKLTQIGVNLSGMEDRKSELAAAMATGDREGAAQQQTVLKIYASQVSNLMSEAENCIGESDVVIDTNSESDELSNMTVGGSEIIVEIDENIVIDGPSGSDLNEIQQIDIDQLPHASGYY